VVATLAVGALVLATAIAVALSHASVRRTGTNDVVISGIVDTLHGAHRLCQDGELLPAGTTALELTVTGRRRPALAVELLDPATGAPVAAGTTDAWGEASATVRLRPRSVHERGVRVCVRLRTPGSGASAMLYGEPAAGEQSATDDGQRLGGRLRVDYVGTGSPSWASFAPTVVARIGRGHAWSGTSVALVATLLTLLSISLAAWLLARTS